MTARIAMPIISEQNTHFSDFLSLIQQSLLKRVTESNNVCWFFLIFLASLCWWCPGINLGPLLSSISLPRSPDPALWHSVLSQVDFSPVSLSRFRSPSALTSLTTQVLSKYPYAHTSLTLPSPKSFLSSSSCLHKSKLWIFSCSSLNP